MLTQPLLRRQSASRPARVCYLKGIAAGPGKERPTPETERTCVDLARSREAAELTASYDGGGTIFDLRELGLEFSRDGLAPERGETSVEGLEVERVYTLPDREARKGAREVD